MQLLRFFVYVFVLLEKQNSGDVDPWRGWFGHGHCKGPWEDISCTAQPRTALWSQRQRRSHNPLNVTHDGPSTLSPAGWRAGHRRIIMSRRSCVLFYIHCRFVLLQPSAYFPTDLCHLETIASMFCKSCNCNSSIATRIGFAVRSCYNDSTHPFLYPMSDDICAELHACVAHEDPVHDRPY